MDFIHFLCYDLGTKILRFLEREIAMTKDELRDYGKIIAKNLRRIMLRANKTQADLSRELGIGKTTISAWMNGVNVPRMDKIDMLCNYFGCTRADIMEPHDEGYYLREDTAKMAQEIFEDREMRILFDAARNSRPEDLRMASDLLKRLKATNPDG